MNADMIDSKMPELQRDDPGIHMDQMYGVYPSQFKILAFFGIFTIELLFGHLMFGQRTKFCAQIESSVKISYFTRPPRHMSRIIYTRSV